jgi:chorismate synthase
MLLTEQEIYGDLLLRKPGADELSSPRKEPDLPIIYSGLRGPVIRITQTELR